MTKQLGEVIAEAEQALDTDAKLAASMTKAGNVLVPSFFVLGEPQGKADKPLAALCGLKSRSTKAPASRCRPIRGQYPIEAIGSARGRHRPPEPAQ